jgi:aminomuconate-semialdehyde/2-hydroxymuconate-6-semialdehyde dehydrogenase
MTGITESPVSRPPELQVLDHLIDGEFVPASSGETFDTHDPYDGSVIATVARGTAEDAARAVSAARVAFDEGQWPRMSTGERRQILYRFAELVESRAEEIARLETRDVGRPIRETRGFDVVRVAQNLRFFADFADLAASEAYPTAQRLTYVLHPPAGMVVAIAPWHFPIMLASWKIAPALAFGNTVVLKPAEQTPVSAALLGELGQAAGLPPGTLNVVHGFGPGEVGEALTLDPRVDRITFTGATDTGRQIMRAGAANLTPVSFELGGKSANVVFADADLDAALAGSIRAVFSNNGAMCLAGSRLLIEHSVYDEFAARYVAAAGALSVGDPKDATTDVGPLVERVHLEKVHGYVEQAQQEGGELLVGGTLAQGANGGGLEYPPTVLGRMRPEMRAVREEIFGPVQVLLPFHDEAEALTMANDSTYGLAGMVWTRDLDRAHRMARNWRAGNVWVNCFFERDLRAPFGGERDSGVGREGGHYSREFFTEPRTVVVKHRDPE